jgi:hypothetical protein
MNILRLCVCFFIIVTTAAFLPADGDDLLEDDLDVDSLFEEEDVPQDEEKDQEEPEKEEAVNLLKDVVKKEDFSFEGNFQFYIGYTPGLGSPEVEEDEIEPVDDADATTTEPELQYDDSALLKMSSTLTLNFRISPEFRVFQKYGFSFPKFTPEVQEFFCDYALKDIVFFRLGRHKVTWGQSPNFPFTNLPARVPDDYSEDLTDSYAVKVDLPIGVGGISGLVFTRNGYFENIRTPSFDEIGYGGTANLAVEYFDLTVGTFYHKLLHYRTFGTLKTTLFNRLELYTEALIAHDYNWVDPNELIEEEEAEEAEDENSEEEEEKFDNQTDLSANIGFLIDFFSQNLEINGEYFFNGEESELNVKGSQYPLFYGHNIAANISLKLFNKKLRLLGQFKYNINENSGVLIPGITLDVLPHFALNLGAQILVGSTEGGYFLENPDPLDRPYSFIVALKFSGKK